MFVFIVTDGPCVGIGVCMYVGGSVWGQDESRGGVQVGSLTYGACFPAALGSVIKQRSTFAGLCLAIESR